MNLRPTLAFAAALLFAAAAPARADEDPLRARLDFAQRYLQFPDLVKDNLGPHPWLPDGDRFVYWAGVGPHRGTWVVVDARRRTAEPLLPSAALSAELTKLAGKPVALPRALAFALWAGGREILFRLEGRAYSVGLADRRVVALKPGDRREGALSPEVRPSPDGRASAATQAGGLAVVGGEGRAVLERRGEAPGEWRLPERPWSPDGKYVAAWRDDARAVHTIPIVDYSTAVERVKMVPYSKAGTPLVRSELHFVELATGRLVRVTPPAEEGYSWLSGYRPDGGEALVLWLSRDGKRLDLLAVTPSTGASRRVLREERPQTFVGALDFYEGGWALQVTPLADNRRFVWMSERDGFRHAYLYDYSGALQRQLTRGPFPVHRVLGADHEGKALLVVASAEPAEPYDQLLYRAPLDGGALQRLSADPGVHRVSLSPSGRYYLDGHSTRTRPRRWDVAPAGGGRPFRYAEADVRGLAPLHYAPPEGFTALAADGATTLHGVLFKPYDFDPKKRYAVIDLIYGGPWLSVVPWGFIGTGESRLAGSLAQMGFVVMVLDARGTPGKSKAFQDANYGRVGQTEIPDHAAALRQAAAGRPYIDLTRAGIYGGSWGGYFALRGMLTAPDLFKAGYAMAPGALAEDAVVNEPNLGLPSQNPAGYAAGSNEALAGNLRGALKIAHGTGDTSAPVSATMRMVEALIRQNKRFDLLVLPGQEHNLLDPFRLYQLDDARRFFVEKLGGPR